MSLNVLLIGSGGREYALAWKIYQSPQLGKLFIAPGNGGTDRFGENVPIPALDIDGQVRFARANHIDLVVVGPDDPLAMGIADRFRANGILVFGPSREAALIESSKEHAKRLMAKARIPTAQYRSFRTFSSAYAYVLQQQLPIVIKANGLAQGKGVFICHTVEEAGTVLGDILVTRSLGDAGATVIIEEYLSGDEVSVHALSDGTRHLLLPSVQDHKAVGEGGTGKNTGGMGAYGPVPWLAKGIMTDVDRYVVAPALAAMRDASTPFVGCLYPGLMLTSQGPRVLEFNSRLGDPETQVILPLLRSDLLPVLLACAEGNLGDMQLDWYPGYAACVVLTSGGYPGTFQRGLPIQGYHVANMQTGVEVFQAGTMFDDTLRTAGGRVLGVTAVGDSLAQALARAYEAVKYISFEGMYYRRDIGRDALLRG